MVSPVHAHPPGAPGQVSSRDRPCVLVTGAHGQLGAAMVAAFADRDVVAHTRATLDVTDARAVRQAVAAAAPQVIVNCAAYNDVDGAESAIVEALAVNAFAVANLARAAEDTAATLVHFGTDFVFDGTASTPYREEARPCPRGAYAASKLLGEWFALDAPGAFVLRVESLFGSPAGWTGRRGSIDRIADALTSGREVRAFADRVVSPGYVVDIAAATRHLLASGAAPGLYHCVNRGSATWVALAQELASMLGVTRPRIVPVAMADAGLAAPRPAFCALSVEKLEATGFSMPSWQDGLRRWLAARGTAAT